MKIEIQSNSLAVKDYFDKLAQKHLPYARFQAVNKLAFLVKDATITDMKTIFDRPRPDYTLQALDVIKARYTDWKSQQQVSAKVLVTDYKGQDKYLGHHFTGDDRAFKRFEARLKYANILPAGMWAVPGQAMPLDQYGNANRSALTQILRYLQAFNFIGDSQNMKAQGKARFAKKNSRVGSGFEVIVSQGKGTRGPNGRVQSLPAGIYYRYSFASGSSLKPMLIFVKRRGGYKRRVFMDLIGDRVIADKGLAVIGEELAKAIANDKPTNAMMKKIV